MVRRAGLGLLVALLLLVVAELALRLGGVEATEGWAPPRLLYIVQNGQMQHTVELRDAPRYQEVGGGVMATNPLYAGKTMRDLRFTREPALGVARWFVVGESAVVGQHPVRRPPLPTPPGGWTQPEPDWTPEPLPGGPLVLPDALSIPGQLGALLGPGVEVLNAGRIAQDSDDMRVEVLELLEYGPTGIVLYLGNNESLMLARALAGESVPEVRATRTWLRRLRLYRVISDLVVPRATRRLEQKDLPRDVWENVPSIAVVTAEWDARGEVAVDANQAPTDTVHDALLARFRRNLSEMASAARARGVRLVVAPCPPDLLREPFASASDPLATEVARAEAEAHVARVGELVTAGDLPGARDAADEALIADAGSARAWFARGVARAWAGEAPAVGDLQRALALDPSRKRSSPSYVGVAREVCADQGCVVVDLYTRLLTAAARDGVIPVWLGFFGDHEHLLPAGNATVAEAVAEAIRAGG